MLWREGVGECHVTDMLMSNHSAVISFHRHRDLACHTHTLITDRTGQIAVHAGGKTESCHIQHSLINHTQIEDKELD